MNERDDLPLDAVRGLLVDSEPWLSCDDCFETHDAAVEHLLEHGEPFGEPLRVHLVACGACHEEARSLAALIAGEFGMTSADAIARLEAALATPA